jgi:photosystem II stability/assembly factor-like uncharacterized protein
MKKIYQNSFLLKISLMLMLLGIGELGFAQKNKSTSPTFAYDTTYFNSLEWRNIGPFRGGRSAAVTGVPGQPNLYYFGAAGGGVWRTTDAGASWENISDGYFGGSIGAVAVSESDPNVIYVGGGEKTVRGNVSHGLGMWKSVDAGKTWEQIGLKDSRHITRIRIHPNNPDLVYAAALGHLFGPNQERGVFRSKDGGKTWEKSLFANDNAGAMDLIIDPVNPRILFASTWRVRRTPYTLESGGEGSALWKSTDGGDNWTELTKESEGLPKGILGIIGVTVSPVNHELVWAIIEANDGGVFRSDNGGKTWRKLTDNRNLRQRAWYYTRIYADTKNEDLVYVLNVQFHRSKDGGKTYETISTPHSDHHDLWISPENPNHMIIADDGGAQVSLNGGESWSTYENQPTSQLYRITTDNHFPYRIYSGQQDNSALRIASRSDDSQITERDWQETAGGESGHIVANPNNPDIVYGGSYGGFLTRLNHKTSEIRAVDVYPDNHMGWAAKDVRYRFQWNFPILFSPHDPNILYCAANVLFKTTNEGQSWEAISPDLTRNDTTRMEASGGPLTKDNTSVEYYGTIFAVAEAPNEKGVIWTGSDDGLVYITRDEGKNWTNVTPKGMPEWMMINSIEPHPFIKGGCYVAGTRYKSDDFTPYLYKTTDYGKTWTKITNGIANDHFTRVLRADPDKQGILYAGTELGMYVSFDDGANWQSLQLNIPQVPITDLAIKENDLIAATQGRGYWILDNISLLHQLEPSIKSAKYQLFKPEPTYNNMGGQRRDSKFAGKNPISGVGIHYYLAQKPDTSNVVSLEILDPQGKLIKKYSTKLTPEEKKEGKVGELEAKKGANLFAWNMRYPEAATFDGLILWFGGTQGAEALPGTYQAKLTVGDDTQMETFEIVKDPRLSASQSDLQARFDLLMSIRDKLTETHESIKKIREIRGLMKAYTDRLEGEDEYKSVLELSKEINKKLTKVEETLYQVKNRSGQDPLNYPVRLNNRLSALGTMTGYGYNKPTSQMYDVQKDITSKIDAELNKFNEIVGQDLPKLNDLIYQLKVPAIQIDKPTGNP